MYHKKPDKQNRSLADWIEESDERATRATDEVGWRVSKDRPKPLQPVQRTPRVPTVPEYERTFSSKKKEPSMKKTLSNKLIDEKSEYEHKILKMDDKIINPIGISENEIKLLTLERNSLANVVKVLELRIEDLESGDNE